MAPRPAPRWAGIAALTSCIAALLTASAQAAEPTVVSLTFDDAPASQYETRSMLAASGMHATFYVNSGRVGEGGYLTGAQLLDLQADGNEIAGHTVNHADLWAVDLDEQRRQICNDRSTLLSWGLRLTSFAYPFGNDGPEIAQVARDCGYNSARDTGGISEGEAHAESIPPADAFAIRAVEGDSVSLGDLQTAVTRAEQAGGGWVPFYFHGVCDACGSHAVSPSTLAAFLDWLAQRGSAGTTVRTVSEVIGGDVQPAVPGPPPPAARSGNMLLNPSLETDSDGRGAPDCWQRNAWGTSESSWTRTTDAHSGGFAERVDVTSFSTGAVRLLSAHDLGYCAPTAIAGHSYKLRAWYKGSVRPRLVAFYRTGIGAWRVLGQSSRFSASTSWKRARWTAPPVPAGANGIGIGVAVERVGSLTMDDLAVSDTNSP